MKLKGNYNGEETYDVGDVVVFDGVVYHLQSPCKAGTPPKDTLYWSRVNQQTEESVFLIMDALGMVDDIIQTVQGSIPTNISEDAVVLKSSTPDSDKEFIITVDDDGELSADEITDNTPAEGGEPPAEGGETPAEGGETPAEGGEGGE